MAGNSINHHIIIGDDLKRTTLTLESSTSNKYNTNLSNDAEETKECGEENNIPCSQYPLQGCFDNKCVTNGWFIAFLAIMGVATMLVIFIICMCCPKCRTVCCRIIKCC